MTQFFRALLLACAFVGAAEMALAQTRVLKCVAADGSVSYSSAQSCTGDAVGQVQELPAHRVTKTEEDLSSQRGLKPPRQPMSAEDWANARRLAEIYGDAAQTPSAPVQPRPQRPAAPVSYRCAAAGGVWYQHSPCPEALGGGDRWPNGAVEPGIAVKQEEVLRSEACHEMNRMGSSARAGRKMDERASPYEKHTGKDKCR